MIFLKLALVAVTLVGTAASLALAQRTSNISTAGGSVRIDRHRDSAYQTHNYEYRRGIHYRRHHLYDGYPYRFRSHYYGHRGLYYAPRGYFFLEAPYARHYGYPYYRYHGQDAFSFGRKQAQ